MVWLVKAKLCLDCVSAGCHCSLHAPNRIFCSLYFSHDLSAALSASIPPLLDPLQTFYTPQFNDCSNSKAVKKKSIILCKTLYLERLKHQDVRGWMTVMGCGQIPPTVGVRMSLSFTTCSWPMEFDLILFFATLSKSNQFTVMSLQTLIWTLIN